jgi:hypothetical protein
MFLASGGKAERKPGARRRASASISAARPVRDSFAGRAWRSRTNALLQGSTGQWAIQCIQIEERIGSRPLSPDLHGARAQARSYEVARARGDKDWVCMPCTARPDGSALPAKAGSHASAAGEEQAIDLPPGTVAAQASPGKNFSNRAR